MIGLTLYTYVFSDVPIKAFRPRRHKATVFNHSVDFGTAGYTGRIFAVRTAAPLHTPTPPFALAWILPGSCPVLLDCLRAHPLRAPGWVRRVRIVAPVRTTRPISVRFSVIGRPPWLLSLPTAPALGRDRPPTVVNMYLPPNFRAGQFLGSAVLTGRLIHKPRYPMQPLAASVPTYGWVPFGGALPLPSFVFTLLCVYPHLHQTSSRHPHQPAHSCTRGASIRQTQPIRLLLQTPALANRALLGIETRRSPIAISPLITPGTIPPPPEAKPATRRLRRSQGASDVHRAILKIPKHNFETRPRNLRHGDRI